MKRLRAEIFLMTVVVMVLAVGSPALAATNLLTNPGFEASSGSYDGWFTFGNVVTISTPATDNIAHSGSAAAKVFGDNACPGSFTTRGFGQSFTPTAGMTYQFIVLGVVMIVALFIARPWCRFLCPIQGVERYINQVRLVFRRGT